MLKELMGDSKLITVIGLCKNAGKTTALRRLMAEYKDEVLGLTSIGRDGESSDLVTGTPKPELYLKSGDLFATARGMLSLCDTTCRVEALTGVNTPLGEVAVLRAMSDGFVQLAGPSAVGRLNPLAELLFELGAGRVLIDGAAGRRSLAGAGAFGCTILCTGASLDWDMAAVVDETAFVCSLFEAKRPSNPDLCRVLDGLEARFALFTPKGERLDLPEDEGGTPQWNLLPREPVVLWVGGAVTDPMIKTLTSRGAQVSLVTHDATHVLAGREHMGLFLRAGNTLAVRRERKLAAVCANPWSASGRHFESGAFCAALRDAIALPVVDVQTKKEGSGWS